MGYNNKTMRRFALILLALLCGIGGQASAQSRYRTRGYVPYSQYGGGYMAGSTVDPISGDTTYTVQLSDIIVYRSIGDIRRHKRLIRNVKAVYPYAVDARNYFRELNDTLATVTDKRLRNKITKAYEDEIVERYTPVLEKMTFTQGKILLRLIDRETQRTSYELLEEFRGRFSAKFWNMIAKIFKADLKQRYDPTKGEDKLIEQIINLYEAGLL